MSETVTEPHVLVVEAYIEEDDIYEYEIRHPDSCGTETYTDEGLDGRPHVWTRRTCLVEHELDHVGLDGLTDNGNQRIEPGEYKIEGWSIHYPSTPVSGEEWYGGLRFVEEST